MKTTRTLAALLIVLTTATAVWASGATFALRGAGITLGEPKELHEDGKPLPPRYFAKAELGKPFTLFAQGMIMPRGAKASPGEPEAGEWHFDAKKFKRLDPVKKSADKTTIAVRLEPAAVGVSRIRFTGKILGYEHTFDVMVEVTPAKASAP